MGLFTPKWIEDPEETKKLTDQRKLQKAFAKAHHPGVLKAAGWRIEDQAFLGCPMEEAFVPETVSSVGRHSFPPTTDVKGRGARRKHE